MPSYHYNPRIALSARFDARPWAGVKVIDRGGGYGTLPTDIGIYDDVLTFLNGYGSGVNRTGVAGVYTRAYDFAGDLQALADISPGAPLGTFDAYIDESDRVVITNDTYDIQVYTASSGNELGFEVGAQAPSLQATKEWVRGPTSGSLGIGLSVKKGPGYALLLTIPGCHSIPTYVRTRDEGDADSALVSGVYTLEDFDADEGSEPRVRWYIDGDGHVVCSYPTTLTDLGFPSATFAARLGFTGDEVPVSVGSYDVMTATYPCPGLIVPTRPAMFVRTARDQRAGSARLANGDATAVELLNAPAREVRVYVGGEASATDEEFHYLDKVLPYALPGWRFHVYQDWSDPRRAAAPRDQSYGNLYNVERGGRLGRLRAKRDPEDDVDNVAAYDEGAVALRFEANHRVVLL